MPNWCSTAYAIEGDAKEIKSLYELMKRLEDMEKPSVENGFGTTWLGCLVDALGKDWHNVHCRGSWSCLELEGDVLKRHGLRVMRHLTLYWRNIHHSNIIFRQKSRASEYMRPTMKTEHISATDISWMPALPMKNISVNISRNWKMRSNGLKKKSGSPSGLWRMSMLLPLLGKNKMRTLFAICTSLMW